MRNSVAIIAGSLIIVWAGAIAGPVVAQTKKKTVQQESPAQQAAPYFSRGYGFLQVREYDQAIREYEMGLSIYRSDPGALFQYGTLLETKGRYADAVSVYRESIITDPTGKSAAEAKIRFDELSVDRNIAIQRIQGIVNQWGDKSTGVSYRTCNGHPGFTQTWQLSIVGDSVNAISFNKSYLDGGVSRQCDFFIKIASLNFIVEEKDSMINVRLGCAGARDCISGEGSWFGYSHSSPKFREEANKVRFYFNVIKLGN